MFDFVHQNKRMVQVVLAVIILPFAFWGVESYRSSAGESLATVNGEKISQQEFDNALRQQQDRMRELMGERFDPSMFDKPDVKMSVLDNLINQRLLTQQARTVGLAVNDEQLAQVIAGIDAFQRDGRFDKQLYESVLKSQGMTSAVFEERVRDELGMRQLTDGYVHNGYISGTALDNLIRLSGQQRVISTALIGPEAFLGQVKVDDAAIKDYYDKNAAEFHLPERARVEYVAFSVDALLPQTAVSEAEIKAYYDEHQAEFGTQEQRQAAHILIAVPAQASDADKQAARAKAEQVLQQAKQSPDKFAELAKQYSQDPGSASNGGDLGTFGRGMMVKPFEEAVYHLKPGEISGLVQSDFGYHIIKLLAVTPSSVQPLSAVRGAVENKLKQQKAADKFAELAEKFSNAVYEQSDSLKPAAELVKAKVEQSAWLNKGHPGAAPWTDKALQAVFSSEVVKDKRNSAAVEIAPNSLLAVRMLEYQPPSARPLAEVSDAIRQKLQRQQALSLAVSQGKDLLAQLRRGEAAKVEWRPVQSISYTQATQQDGDLGRQIFRVDAAKLPAYVGEENAQGGYLLVRVEAVNEASVDDGKRPGYAKQLRELTGEEVMQAFLMDARKRADISVRGFATEEKK